MRATERPQRLGEVQAWPPVLLDDLPAAPWVVAHVRPRQEKLFASNLRRADVPHLLFLEHSVRTYERQGIQHSLVPLLPGYVFFVGRPGACEFAYFTERIVRLIHVLPHVDVRRELGDLAAMVLRVDAPLVVRPELAPGTEVILKTGSLAGLRGVIARRRGRVELVVNLHALGHSVSTLVNAADADPA